MHHNNISVFDFNSESIRVIIVDSEPWFVAKDVCRILTISNVSKALNRIDEEDKGAITLSDIIGNDQNHLIINESGFYTLVLGSRKEVAKPFKKWVTSDVLPSIRKTGKYELEQNREQLERSIQEKAAIKEIREAYNLYKEAYGDAYAYRYLHQQMHKHQPHLAGDEPLKEERPSLPAKALLTPTDIAAKLNIFYGSGNPNPRKVNELLCKAGYQTKENKAWNPTQKAIDANLADRKPVDTNSRTQKDQLLWSEDIIDILKEFSIN